MSKDIYAVWDFESGNIIYAYDTERQAFDLVREQIDAYGPDAVRRWGISRDRRGRITRIAVGDELVAQVERMRDGSTWTGQAVS